MYRSPAIRRHLICLIGLGIGGLANKLTLGAAGC